MNEREYFNPTETSTDDSDDHDENDGDRYPLKEISDDLQNDDSDPFAEWWSDEIPARDLAENTKGQYARAVNHWQRFMHEETDRHPAAPKVEHVRQFIRHWRDEREASASTINGLMITVNDAYEYFMEDGKFDHPADHNPVKVGRERESYHRDGNEDERRLYRLDENDLQQLMEKVTDIRARTMIAAQFKWGLRASEVANIQLCDIHIDDPLIEEHYPDLGTNWKLDGFENAIVIDHEHDGNKSNRDRILPIDYEMRVQLKQYLLIRPENGEKELFLSENRNLPIGRATVADVWSKWIKPHYPGDEHTKPLVPHYGRHMFTHYWKVTQDINTQLAQYMRGDGMDLENETGAITEYLHPNYKEIEPLYREDPGMYQLGLSTTNLPFSTE